MGSTSFKNKVVGIFSDKDEVHNVIRDLNNSGYDKDDISILARDMKEGDTIKTHGGSTTYPTDTLRDTELGTNLNRDDVLTGSDVYPTGNMGKSSLRSDMTGTGIGSSVDKDLDEDVDFEDVHDVKEKDPNALVKGAATGGAIGLLGGLAVLMIPGIGPVLAAGPIYTAITAAAGGAALGATAGTIIGLLKDEGIPNDRADFYSRNFNRGNVIVMVHTEEGRSALAREILLRYNPETVDTF
jgi:hypothetical protein